MDVSAVVRQPPSRASIRKCWIRPLNEAFLSVSNPSPIDSPGHTRRREGPWRISRRRLLGLWEIGGGSPLKKSGPWRRWRRRVEGNISNSSSPSECTWTEESAAPMGWQTVFVTVA
ncbi:hypothetical protein HRR83_005949 [Exophiala dermatitidis]|uniref:Uncharacterized protein n=1 Tax=Exophiala dermatitidis TaxID=5970 RepID=A0AAN6IRC9_EXODE|nr:hypothetical protein HRR74_008076 [Exophiala dermatitidis]KAJ4517373.1 hypothetical protein HRR73_004425 [Exophiala dermatitidis]KAJ4548878.1 hypothetical protein HRR76_001456 [Exophiala dermatitidis]KAJ4552402.1 hypothetical protein HRR77_002415 [Exophiala dermatitidis]KAJ4568354.1 hypothetical protein HRR79_004580 [Exophiala dermatitidis]